MMCVMTFRRILLTALAALSTVAGALAEVNPPPVPVDFFFEPGCVECRRVREEVLPELEARFTGLYVLNEYDMSQTSNVVRLVAYQEALKSGNRNAPVSMVIDSTHALEGLDAIRTGLLDTVESAVAARLQDGWEPPPPIVVPVAASGAGGGSAAVTERAHRFALAAVLGAGLADGVNPCAISTLVFFMSMLAVARVRGRGLLLMGVAFCAASFITYTALGFGLLRAIHSLSVFPRVQEGLRWTMVAALAVLAAMSLLDAVRFRRTGDPHKVLLQLPRSVKDRIHAVIRTRLHRGSMVLGGLTVGALVTLLESVCTGQVYVPTLVVVIRSGQAATREWMYLLLYNVMFILPLTVVFILTYAGLRTEVLMRWSRTNVVYSKVALGILFILLAALTVLL